MRGELSDIDLRLAEPGEGAEVLAFATELGFNARDPQTWRELSMSAVIATRAGDLVAVVPFEPRTYQLGRGRRARALHQTTVAVAPSLRGRGLGSSMQSFLLDAAPQLGVEVLTVFREQPGSGAYRWYLKNGFQRVMHVESWFAHHPSGDERYEVLDVDSTSIPWDEVQQLRADVLGVQGGVVARDERPLRRWLAIHPYRSQYRFALALLRAPGGDDGGSTAHLRGYAVLGIGRLHSETERVDILEIVVDGTCEHEASLVSHILGYAGKRDLAPVRWPVATTDPARAVAIALGFDAGWSFDFLVRPVAASSGACGACDLADVDGWRYQSIDYI